VLFDEDPHGDPTVDRLGNAYGWISELAEHKYSHFPRLSRLYVLTLSNMERDVTHKQQNDSLLISGKEWDYSPVEEALNSAEINRRR
jgi:hypothetical protein